KIAGVIAICITGLALAFGEGGGLMRKILGIVFGLSIAFSASSFGLSFFGYGGGLGF
ncbi:MAG: TrbC/VirB2 family protein, partial [Smithella sp.]